MQIPSLRQKVASFFLLSFPFFFPNLIHFFACAVEPDVVKMEVEEFKEDLMDTSEPQTRPSAVPAAVAPIVGAPGSSLFVIENQV